MTPPFTRILRRHYRVINWPNLNIVVSQTIGRPKERERDGGIASGESSQSTHNIYH